MTGMSASRTASASGRRLPLAAVVALLGLVLAGCTVGTDYESTPLPEPSRGDAAPPPAAATQAPDCGNPLASYAPQGALPGPGSLPAGSTMAKIRKRGRLVAGVSADTLLWGSRNPFTGRIEGFDIDVLRAVAQAIFGSEDKIEFRVITTSQRISALQNGDVDIVARTMTINCARWADIAFSAEYYRAGQKILVRKGSGVRDIGGLAKRRVCAPKGSTSLDNLRKEQPTALPMPADTHTGCLVLFQQGRVDAITGDDAILAGLAAQDPYAEVVGAAFSEEPYGLGISKDNQDLVRFVNGVLERMRRDGEWRRVYDRWLRADLGPAPAPPDPVYGRRP